jgi:hypothetical protein
VPSSTAPVPALARNTALAVPDSPVSMMSAPSLMRVTADHLSLIKALLQAGQTARAMEMLDSVWHPTSPEEQCWYLRIWLLTAEGRVVEALDVARLAARELPGSPAVAYLQAMLEHLHGESQAAMEAGARAQRLAPEQPITSELLAMLAADNDAFDAPAGESRLPAGTALPDHGLPGVVPNPLLAAQMGASLLFPLGSPRPLVPAPGVRPAREVSPPAAPATNRRLGLIGIATVMAALWAVRDPVPAFLALAGIVVLTIRNPQR